MKILLIALVALATIVQARFSDSFRAYFANQTELLEDVVRDRDRFGSFGGGKHVGGQRTVFSKIPILIVHGAGRSADYFDILHREEFIKRGYSEETVYATSWATSLDSQFFFRMKCEYVKRIRNMIIAVSKFTDGKVDIVAYEEGSPIARKAILGGKCIDTNEELGDSLKYTIRSFVSVRGINQGIYCDPSDEHRPTCENMKIGLNCASEIFKDINAKDKGLYLGYSIVPTLPVKTNCGSDTFVIPDSKVFKYNDDGITKNVRRVVEILTYW